jgi:N-acyl-D-amino-acid deacylase
MTYDLLIKDGLVVDGSGMAPIRADVGIKGGKIVARGKLGARASRVIDAQGRVVCPGFIDIHTHYDPHWWWNPLGTSSSWQGVTTVVQGNCGLTLAPCRPEHRAVMAGVFSSVEEISMATLDAVVPWKWESFREYLDQLEGRLGINVGTLLGHSAIRLYAMGEASLERAARPEEISHMQKLLREAMEAGAVGWSTSKAPAHVGPKGAPIPSRQATDEELFALADTLGEYHCGAIEIVPQSVLFGINQEDRKLLHDLARRSGRPVNWLGHEWKWFAPDLWREEQRWMAESARQGGQVFGNIVMQPFDREVTFKRSTFFQGLNHWRDIMSLPLEQRKAKLADQSLRPALREALDNPDYSGTRGSARPPIRWEGVSVLRTGLTKNRWMEGKSVVELAKQRGVHVADVMSDLAAEEDLETVFHQRFVLDVDTGIMGDMIQDQHVVFGSSDSGAHINSMVQSGEPAYCLRHWVLDHPKLTLEEAVRRLTFVPASVLGFYDRGLVREGLQADINVLSLQDLELGRKELVQDLPSGETRWIQKAKGIDYTIVNGEVLMERGSPNEVLPGKVLRGGAYRSN